MQQNYSRALTVFARFWSLLAWASLIVIRTRSSLESVALGSIENLLQLACGAMMFVATVGGPFGSRVAFAICFLSGKFGSWSCCLIQLFYIWLGLAVDFVTDLRLNTSKSWRSRVCQSSVPWAEGVPSAVNKWGSWAASKLERQLSCNFFWTERKILGQKKKIFFFVLF